MDLVLCLCLLLIAPSVIFSAEPFVDEPPASIITTKGDTILLRCGVVRHVTATLSWQNMDSGDIITEGPEIDPYFNFQSGTRNRLSIIGDRSNGEYHLQIRDIVSDDSGHYACFYYDAKAKYEQQSNIVEVNVMRPLSKYTKPRCTMEPTQNHIGDNVTLICVSMGGDPPPALAWIREKEILNVQYTPDKEKSINRISVILTEKDIDIEYMCLARNPATLKEPQSCSVKPLRTSINVRIRPSNLKVYSDTVAKFNCISDVVPGLLFKWYINRRFVGALDNTNKRFRIRRKGRRFIIFPVLPSDNLTQVTCVVEQPESNLEASATAILHVEPKPVTTPQLTTDLHTVTTQYMEPTRVPYKTAATERRTTTNYLTRTATTIRTQNIKTTKMPKSTLRKIVVTELKPTPVESFTTDSVTKLTTGSHTKPRELCRGESCIVVATSILTPTISTSTSTSVSTPATDSYIPLFPFSSSSSSSVGESESNVPSKIPTTVFESYDSFPFSEAEYVPVLTIFPNSEEPVVLTTTKTTSVPVVQSETTTLISPKTLTTVTPSGNGHEGTKPNTPTSMPATMSDSMDVTTLSTSTSNNANVNTNLDVATLTTSGSPSVDKTTSSNANVDKTTSSNANMDVTTLKTPSRITVNSLTTTPDGNKCSNGVCKETTSEKQPTTTKISNNDLTTKKSTLVKVPNMDLTTKAGDTKAGDTKADDTKAGDTKAGDTKAGDTKAGVTDKVPTNQMVTPPREEATKHSDSDGESSTRSDISATLTVCLAVLCLVVILIIIALVIRRQRNERMGEQVADKENQIQPTKTKGG
ncbi:uncharacterized protein [Amphiura filiformis]|uniref:uncharacterized protein isoform X2 n=1 Tax=Amphiura filiformis TaxID=82378 RepID=UPI003B2193C0